MFPPLLKRFQGLAPSNWYHRERARIASVCPQDIPLERFIAVIAIISPGRRWNSNISDALELTDAWRAKLDPPNHLIRYDRRTLLKAYAILDGETFQSGPKVTAFYGCLCNPEGHHTAPIDRHILHVWARSTHIDKVTLKQYRILENRLVSLARRYSIPVCALQAALWETEISEPHVKGTK